jgi:hypothetical protein
MNLETPRPATEATMSEEEKATLIVGLAAKALTAGCVFGLGVWYLLEYGWTIRPILHLVVWVWYHFVGG